MRGAEDAIPIGEAPEAPTAEEVFLRSESVLLAPGEFTIEPGFFYFERQEDVLVFSGGVAAGLAELDEKAFTFDLRTRVGVFDETEFEVIGAPFDIAIRGAALPAGGDVHRRGDVLVPDLIALELDPL